MKFLKKAGMEDGDAIDWHHGPQAWTASDLVEAEAMAKGGGS